MAAILIGIDLCHTPLLVGCQIASTVLVQAGSKGAKLNSSRPKGRMGLCDFDGEDEDVLEEPKSIAASGELFECFKDARSVAKSFFGSPNIRGAVAVVPNGYDHKALGHSIVEAAKRASIHILQIIPERIAVAAAYAHKTKPAEDSSTITVISSTAGACDAYRVSVRLTEGTGYRYQVESPKSHGEEAAHHAMHEDEKDGELKKMLEESIENMFCSGTMGARALPAALTKQQKEEKVVFVGNSAELLKVREIINDGFTLIKEWKDATHDSDQLAVYGAVELAFLGNYDTDLLS